MSTFTIPEALLHLPSLQEVLSTPLRTTSEKCMSQVQDQKIEKLVETSKTFNTLLDSIIQPMSLHKECVQEMTKTFSGELLLAVQKQFPDMQSMTIQEVDNLIGPPEIQRVQTECFLWDMAQDNFALRCRENLTNSLASIFSKIEKIRQMTSAKWGILDVQCSFRTENYMAEYFFYITLAARLDNKPANCSHCGSANTELTAVHVEPDVAEEARPFTRHWRIDCLDCKECMLCPDTLPPLPGMHVDQYNRTVALEVWKKASEISMSKVSI